MSSGFPSDFKEVVRSRTNLVELVGENVRLTPARGGADFIGLCPFHDDHNPSFHVYPDRQSYRCWVCNEGGDCFSYVEKVEGVSFFEALKLLAERAHLDLPQMQGSSEQAKQRRSEREEMFAAMKWAEGRMHDCLVNSADAKHARDYLQDRGFDQATIEKYRLGYHPDRWDWLLRQAGKQHPLEILLSSRLAAERKNGPGHNDSHIFIDRVVFPIHDQRGRTISFGGRLLPGREGPKYYNGNDSDLFHKSNVFYGFHHAKEAIRRSRRAIVVEGYTDCIALARQGVENVVGVLGTALTEQHVATLRQSCEEVVLVYDGDAAGQMNADRVVSKFLSQEVDLKILTLPEKLDPEEYILAHGKEAFEELFAASLEAWEFKYRNLLEKHGTETLGSRQSILEELLALMGQAPQLAGTNREDSLLGRLAQRLLIPEKKIREQLKNIRSKQSTSFSETSAEIEPESDFERLVSGRLTKHEKNEADLLEIIFLHPQWMSVISLKLNPTELQNRYFQELYQHCCDLHERGVIPTADKVLAELENADLKRLAVVVEDWSHHQGIQAKLDEFDDEAKIPVFLNQTLQILHWRREETKHERTRGEIAGYTSPGSELNEKDQELLQRVMEFHQKRLNNKSTI